MSELLIRAALEKRLNALTPAWQTKWPNTALKPDGNHQVATILWSPASPAGAGRAAATYFSGIFQITAFVAANSGVNVVDPRVKAIIEHFPRGLRITEGAIVVRLLEPYRGPGIDEPDWYSVPVSVPWFAHIKRP